MVEGGGNKSKKLIFNNKRHKRSSTTMAYQSLQQFLSKHTPVTICRMSDMDITRKVYGANLYRFHFTDLIKERKEDVIKLLRAYGIQFKNEDELMPYSRFLWHIGILDNLLFETFITAPKTFIDEYNAVQ